MNTFLRLLCIFLTGVLISCGSGGDGGSPPAGEPQANSSALESFSSDEELETYLKQGLESVSSESAYKNDGLLLPPMVDSANESGGDSGRQFSTTNLQESGVDEADTIKTDGEFLYIVRPAETFNNTAYDEALSKEASLPAAESHEAVRVMKLSDDPAETEQVGEISLKNVMTNRVNGLYLVTDRDGGKPDMLAAVSGASDTVRIDWFCPWCWTNGETEVAFYNVDDPSAPRLMNTIRLDGQLISSRRIGNQLYLVTRFIPDLTGYIAYPSTETEKTGNQELLKKTSLSDLLPRIYVDGVDRGVFIRPSDCYLPPGKDEKKPDPSLVTVTAVDLDAPENRSSCTIAGSTEALYTSSQSIYLASTLYPPYTGGIPEDGKAAAAVPPETTELHKFGLTEDGPVYKGSGAVVGNLGWAADKKSFRMSEYEGVLRIATSLGDTWNETSSTRLTLLKENGEGELEETAHIDHIGETGEQLYAARFVRHRGYLVTFRVTDPLYVFDLSDPENPVLDGELHIDGYSDYLHPVSETLLLGIGKDAVSDEGSDDFGGRGAWYQGVKLSLFDISDPEYPEEVSSLVIGKRGTHSDALYDHHALAWLPGESGNPARLALPIRLHDTAPPAGGWCDVSSPFCPYDWTHTGLYLFEVGEESITNTGKMVVESRSGGDVSSWLMLTDRAVLLENSVHYIRDAKVFSGSWENAEGFNGPE